METYVKDPLMDDYFTEGEEVLYEAILKSVIDNATDTEREREQRLENKKTAKQKAIIDVATSMHTNAVSLQKKIVNIYGESMLDMYKAAMEIVSRPIEEKTEK